MQSESFQATPLDAPSQSRKSGSFRFLACFTDNQRTEDVRVDFPSPGVAVPSSKAKTPACPEDAADGPEADSSEPIDSLEVTPNLVDSPCPEVTVSSGQSESPTFLDAPEACPETQSSEAMGPSDQTQSESFRATPLDAPTQSRLLNLANPAHFVFSLASQIINAQRMYVLIFRVLELLSHQAKRRLLHVPKTQQMALRLTAAKPSIALK
jgi:hypothetical protein